MAIRLLSSENITGDITVTGKILVGTGATAAASLNAFTQTVSSNLFSALRIIENSGASSYWDIGAIGGASTLLNFYHNSTTTPKISFTHTGGATFAGNVTVGNNGNINIPTAASGNANLNFDGTDFKITSNSSSANLKLETNSTTRLTINSAGNATFAGNVHLSDTILGLRSTNDYAIQYRDLDFRLIGSADGTTQRKFSFGYYTSDNPAGTWNGKTYINSYTGQTVIGNTSLPADHMLQISNPGQAYARFALTNSQTGNASGDGLKFQMENLNSIIKNQENGTLGFGTNGRETDILINSSGNATFIGEISSSDDINVNNGKLVVNHTSAEVRIKSTSDTGESFINFADPSDNNVGQIYYGHGTNKMSIRVNDATRLAITSGGDIEVEGGDLFLNSGTNYNDKGVVYFSNERTAIISDIVNATANGDTSLDFQTRKGGARASAMFIDEFRNVGIGTASPYSKFQVNSDSTIGDPVFAGHFGQGTNNTNGVFGGISLGYSENNANYRKVAIVAQATGDGAARQNLLFLVDGASDGNSASIADNKMILNYDGAIKIGNGSNIAINTNGAHYHAAGPSGLSMRQYQYSVSIPNGSTIDLFQNTSAYSDLQMTKISIVMYHSSRTYFAGMGTVGGYALALTGAGIGQANGGLTASVVSTGIRKLQIANNSGFLGVARIFIEIMADSGVTVLNGSISAPY